MNMNRIGMCTACLEMTSLDDPCCVSAGIIVNGSVEFPRLGEKPPAPRSYLFAVEWISRMQTSAETEMMLVKLTADLFHASAVDVTEDVIRYRKTMNWNEGSFLGEYLKRKD